MVVYWKMLVVIWGEMNLLLPLNLLKKINKFWFHPM